MWNKKELNFTCRIDASIEAGGAEALITLRDWEICIWCLEWLTVEDSYGGFCNLVGVVGDWL
jgi:hypothetical protein